MAQENIALKFNPELHEYILDGRRVPSVTEIVGVLTAKDMAKLSPFMLDNAARRGTRVHEVTELIDYGVPLEDIEVEPDIAGYIVAYKKFLRDYNPEWLMIEQRLHDRSLGCAGTLDRYGLIDGKECVVDIKTTASANKLTKIAWAVQTTGYCWLANKPLAKRNIVQLKADGNYTLHDCDKTEKKYGIDSAKLFLKCLDITKVIGDYE